MASHLLPHLKKHELTLLDKLEPATIQTDLRYLKGPLEFDIVIHLGALSNAGYCERNPLEAWEANVLATENLLQAVKIKQKLIFASSAVVYGSNPSERCNEDDSLRPISVYGDTKLAGENIIKRHARRSRLNYAIVRFFNLYGKNQAPAYLIPQLLRQAKEGKITIWNSEAVRDYIYVEDAIDAVLLAMQHGNGVYNIGTGIGTSAGELAEIISSHYGNIPIEDLHKEDKFAPSSLIADNTRIKMLGWGPQCSVREGIRKLVNETSEALKVSPLI